MANVYLKQPHLLANTTEIRNIRQLDDGTVAIVLGQNIIRPETGGQPYDHATVTVGAESFRTGRIFKADGETWIGIRGSLSVLPDAGEMAYVEVDAERRQRLSRCHTLTHLMMAAARHVVEGFDSKGAMIHDDGRTVSIRFRTAASLTDAQISLIDALTRHFVLMDAPIALSAVKSPAAGAEKFPKWRIDSDLGLSGSIRVVEIRGIDANPCSGSHAGRTGEIVAFEMKRPRAPEDGIVNLDAELTPGWTYWFQDNFLRNSSRIDLSAFAS